MTASRYQALNQRPNGSLASPALIMALLLLLLLVPKLAIGQQSVTTQRYNNSRNSVNTAEKVLNTSNVNVNKFGLLFTRPVDGQLYAQPLYLPSLNIGGKVRNVVFVASMHNTVYAFDADDLTTSAPLWSRNLGTSVPTPNIYFTAGNNYADVSTEIGIMSTPVIDPSSGTIYVLAFTQDKVGGPYHQLLYGLDVLTGAIKLGPSEIQANMPGIGYGVDTMVPRGSPLTVQDRLNGNIQFTAMMHMQRPGLLLSNGVIYVSFASHGDLDPYHGWLAAYDANTLNPVAGWSSTPNGSKGGIWMAGTGPAADSDGNIYVMTGNGTFDNSTSFGCSIVKLSLIGGQLNAIDYFTPYNIDPLNAADADLGSSGILLIPGTNYVVGGGKQGRLYVVDRTNLGKHNNSNDNQIIEWWNATNGHIHGTPVFWKSTAGSWLYVWSEYDYLKAYAFTGAALPFQTTPAMKSAMTVPNGMPGGFMTISSNGQDTSTGIIWTSHPYAGDAVHQTVPGILRAFNASTLQELWNSKMLPTRDDFGNFAKFAAPTVVNGKVYLSTFSKQLAVYGQLPTPGAPIELIATPQNGSVYLAWDQGTFAAAYNVKRAAVSGGPYTTIASNVGGTNYTDSTVTNGKTYYYVVTSINANGESVPSNEASASPNTSTAGAVLYKINSGGPVVSPFDADRFFTGGGTGTSTAPVDTSAVTNPAPQAVYLSERTGNFTYTLPKLAPQYNYKLRLHFSENYFTASGKRIFNININGTTALANYDVFAAAGAKNKAIVQEFTIPADSNGKITIQLVPSVNQAKLSGLELLVGGAAPSAPPAPTSLAAVPDNASVALTWAASVNATTYNVKRATTAGGPYTNIASGVNTTSYNDTTVKNGTTYYYVISALNTYGESGNSNEANATPTAPAGGQEIYRINSGPGVFPPFSADTMFTGGGTSSTTTTIDTSGVANPAPQGVYQTERYGDFSYKLTGLIPGTVYTLRFHWAEYIFGPGVRSFNMSLNGNQVLTKFDIAAAAGGIYKAISKDFTATADAGGYINITFVSVGNWAKMSGLEVFTSGAPTPPTAPTNLTAVAGTSQVSLSWTASANATSYNVKRATVSGGPYTTIASGVSTTTYKDTTGTNGAKYYYVVTAVGTNGESGNSNEASATPTAPVPQVIYQINCGTGSYPPFSAERFNSGGYSAKTTSTVDTSGAANPAPQGVYQSERWGSFSYNITGLTPGSSYKLRLHFSEFYWNAAGKRIFNLFLNGTKVLSNFDIYATAGGINKAIVKEFTATADSTGAISITVGNITDNAKLSGFEVLTP